ncbi:MAG: recombinase family protein [Microgenomates group bacterium]
MRAVVYARTSTLDQAREEKVSIPNQVEWAKSITVEKGWIWSGEYIEPGILGDVELEDRVAMIKLLKEARDGLFDIVLIYHSSRFAREADIGMRACRLLGQHRVQTYIRNSPIEPVLPEKFSWGANVGSMYMNAFSFVGDFQENVARSERVRSGYQGLAQRGKLVFAPYGYKKIPEFTINELGRREYDWHFETDPQKALIVKRIYNDYLNKSGSIRNIMLALNKEKIPSPTNIVSSEAWGTATIKNILTNPVYIGKIRWGRKLGGKYLQGKSSTGKQKRVMNKPENLIIKDGTHPKIIKVDDFNRVQEKLKIRYQLRGRAIASKGLLIGLVFCGRCNRKANYKTSKRKKGTLIRHDYVCQTYFRSKTCQRHVMAAIKLHGLVISKLEKIASNTKYRDGLLEKNKDRGVSDLIKTKELLNMSLDQVKKKQSKILEAYEVGIINLADFGKEKDRLDNEYMSLDSKLQNTEKGLRAVADTEVSTRKFSVILKEFKQNFTTADLQKQKNLMQNLIQSIIVNGNKVMINFRI